MRLLADYRAQGAGSLTGQRIDSPQDLATLAQVYRDPRFETLRAFIVKHGRIVDEQAYTSRLPAAVSFGESQFTEIMTRVADVGGDGFYLLHNHPSGNLFQPGAKADEIGARVLDRSDVMGLLGYPDYPLRLNEGKVLAGRGNHNLTAEDWKQVPEWLENPAAVFDSDTVPGALVFLAPKPAANGTPILITVEPNAERGRAEVHLVTNAYDKDSGKAPFNRWIGEGLTRYYNPQKSLRLGTTVGVQFPEVVHPAKGSTQTVYGPKLLRKYRQDNTRHFQGPGPQVQGLGAKAVEQAFAPQLKRLRRNVTVDVTDARPEDVFADPGAAGVEGAYVGGRVMLFAQNIASQARAMQVLRHESMGHFGMQQILGDKFRPTLAAVRRLTNNNAQLAQIAQRVRERYDVGRPNGLNENGDEFVEEVIAAMAEDKVDLPVMRRIIAHVRAFLRRIGLIKGEVARDELYALIAQAGRTAYTRKTPEFNRGSGHRLPSNADQLRGLGIRYAPRAISSNTAPPAQNIARRFFQTARVATRGAKHLDIPRYTGAEK